MLTYNMDVEPRSQWLRTTPGVLALAQPFYCTEAGRFYGRGQFSTARTDKESYILFYTRRGAGLIEQPLFLFYLLHKDILASSDTAVLLLHSAR